MKKKYISERKENVNILNNKIIEIGNNLRSQIELYYSLKKTNNYFFQKSVIPALKDEINRTLNKKEELEIDYMVANLLNEALPYITLKDRFKRFLKRIINK